MHLIIYKLVTISDDTTVKIWRFDQNNMPIEHGPIVGVSERTQHSIGECGRLSFEYRLVSLSYLSYIMTLLL